VGPLEPLRYLAPLLDLTGDERLFESDARRRLFREVLATFADRLRPTVAIGENANWTDWATLPNKCVSSSASAMRWRLASPDWPPK